MADKACADTKELMLAKDQESLAALSEVLETLIGPDGCPWDREQSPESLADYLIEESHELVSAIRANDPKDACSELGDLAFLLLFVARLYARRGYFSLADALNDSRAKMIRRHPHVFAGAHFANMAEQLAAWEAIKRTESKQEADKAKASAGLFSSLPTSLPALIKAYRIHSKAARVGFTWPDEDGDEEVEQQVEAEWLEWLDASANSDPDAMKHEFGDLLFSLVELGRRKGIKASEALELANLRFLSRFRKMEELAEARGDDFASLSLDQKDELWTQAKNFEKSCASSSAETS